MQLMKLNPANHVFSLRHQMENVFDDFFFPARMSGNADASEKWNPAVDIYEEGPNIVVKAELPGMKKENISVDVKDRVLSLKGERFADDEVKKDNYFRRERTYGRFARAFTLPADVNSDEIKAEYTDGVLKVLVPKPEVAKPRPITVH